MRHDAPNHARGCAKSVEDQFVNDPIYGMGSFDESRRWIGWSENEFSHSIALQPTPGSDSSSASRFTSLGPAWLSSPPC